MNTTSIAPMSLILFLLGSALLWGCGGTKDPLDGRTARQARVETQAFIGFTLPEDATVLGYRAGFDERFLKLQLPDTSALDALIDDARMQQISSIPMIIDGMNSYGIGSWWQPRAVQHDAYRAYQADLNTNGKIGEIAIVIDTSDASNPVAYLYAYYA